MHSQIVGIRRQVPRLGVSIISKNIARGISAYQRVFSISQGLILLLCEMFEVFATAENYAMERCNKRNRWIDVNE